jgi:hypothetical protein
LSRPRRAAIYALIALSALLILVSVFATWAKTVILDTDVWVDTSGQFLTNDTIRPALADYLVDQLFSNVDVAQQLEGALPSQLQVLAAPAAAGLRQLATDTANAVLEAPRVQQAWERANRVAHEAFLRVVEGEGTVVSQTGGVVTLNVVPLLQEVAKQVGLSGERLGRLPPGTGQITVLESHQLAAVARLLEVLPKIAFWFGIAGVLLWALAVYLARGRRRETVRAIGLAMLFIGLILVVVRNQVGDALVNALVASDAVKEPSLEAWRIATAVLHDSTITVLVVGSVGLVAAWIAGPTRPAVAVRRFVSPVMPRPEIVYGVYAIAILLVLIWGPTRTTRNLATTIVLFGLATFGLEMLRRQIVREFPDAGEGHGPDVWGRVSAAGGAAVARVRGDRGGGDRPPS